MTAHAPGADPYADPEAPYKADRLSSTKFTEPVLNTARTETILTQEALEDKNATTLREVLRSTAGVTLGSGEGGNAFGDRFFIRGFDARNDVFIDGVRDPGVSIRENFDDEQVEILRGPASSFAGRGTTGGALNIVTKEAQHVDFYHFDTEGGFGDSTKRGTVDINKAISPVLDVRFNGMVQYADVAGRDFTTDNRWGVAGNVSYHPTDNFKLTANYSHTYLWGLPDFGVPTNQVDARAGHRRRRVRATPTTARSIATSRSRRRIWARSTPNGSQRPRHAREQVPGEPFASELHRHDPRESERHRRHRALFFDADLLLGLRPAERAKPVRAGGCHQRPARSYVQIRHGRNPSHGGCWRRVL